MKTFVTLTFGLTLCLFLSLESTLGTLCPGHKIRCSSDQTCCDTKQGSFACCPYPGATCCKDGAHCCPHNTVCDIAHGRCNPVSSQWHEIRDSTDVVTLLFNRVSDHLCPNQEQSCPNNYTCCSLISGGYGCCPFEDGVCCSDKIHCCPSGKTCNTKAGRCE